jgi:hypothetical protein
MASRLSATLVTPLEGEELSLNREIFAARIARLNVA